jgi:DNA topoisomerase-1
MKKFTKNKNYKKSVTKAQSDDFINSDDEPEKPDESFSNIKKSLVIVESPGKIKKIRSYLGNNYIVMASVGHIMDLPPKELGIDLETLEPTYVINFDKKKVVIGLKALLNVVDNIYIATDGDREGEFIGYSLVKLLKLKEYNRIIFHEITKSAITKALNQPIKLDDNMIKAQQCRRITDRLIGFLISPILSKNVKGGYGAGRVQSVIVKIILDKQMAREEFWKNNDSTYFTGNGHFIIDKIKLDCKLQF